MVREDRLRRIGVREAARHTADELEQELIKVRLTASRSEVCVLVDVEVERKG